MKTKFFDQELQLFVEGIMSYLRYMCLFVHSGVQHILCCLSRLVSVAMLQVSLDCPLLHCPIGIL